MKNDLGYATHQENLDKAYAQRGEVAPLTITERAELEAYRAKAQGECEKYRNVCESPSLQQMHAMSNAAPYESLRNVIPGVEIRQASESAINDLGAGQVELTTVDQQVVNKRYAAMRDQAAHPVRYMLKAILRQLAYFLLLMLAVGVGLAVFL